MTLANQFLGEVRHHPFGSSVIFRRNAFVKWRDLSDSHKNPKPSLRSYRKIPAPALAGQGYPSTIS